MDHLERVRALRADTTKHYNCAQALLVGFSDVMGISDEQAEALGANFGSGMMHGATCGALTGTLMVLGMAGRDRSEGTKAIRHFAEAHGGQTECRVLLAESRRRGEVKKDHCDGLVFEMCAYLDEVLDA